MIRKEENVFVPQVNHSILEANVYNVCNQVIGILINEDVSNVQMSKSLIVSKDSVPLVHSSLHSLKIMSVILAQTIATMIKPKWFVLYVLKDKFTIIKLRNVNVHLIGLTGKMIFV